MNEKTQKLEPHKVTKPIQLLAAWLAGLILIDSSFLTAASLITKPDWAAGALVIAAVLNVPMFLLAIFVLQTKFRPEIQEDIYYSKYLETRQKELSKESLGESIDRLRIDTFESNTKTLSIIENLQNQISSALLTSQSADAIQMNIDPALPGIEDLINQSKNEINEVKKEIQWHKYSIQINDLLPNYKAIVSRIRQEGLSIARTFGTTSEPPTVPKSFIISFGDEVAVTPLKKLINLLLPFGLEGIHYADEEFHSRNIYIGSYGYEYQPFLALNEETLAMIDEESFTVESLVKTIKSRWSK